MNPSFQFSSEPPTNGPNDHQSHSPQTPARGNDFHWEDNSPTSQNTFSSPAGRTTPIDPSLSQYNHLQPIIKPKFIDELASDFKLEAGQRSNLHDFVKFGSLDEGLTRPDLVTRLYMLAVTFGNAAERHRERDAEGIHDFKRLFNDINIRLEDSFNFTVVQKAIIRAVTQDQIYQHNRTSFGILHLAVIAALRKEKEVLLFTNVFDLPPREKLLNSMCRKQASSVRNGFRQDLLKSINALSFQTLAQFTFDSASKYKRGGPGENLPLGFTIHNALLRCFAFDNPGLIAETESEGAADDENTAPVTPDTTTLQKRKRGGRITKGEDFWGKVDVYFSTRVNVRGRNLSGEKWKPYVDAVLEADQATGMKELRFIESDLTTPEPSSSLSGTPAAAAPAAQADATGGRPSLYDRMNLD